MGELDAPPQAVRVGDARRCAPVEDVECKVAKVSWQRPEVHAGPAASGQTGPLPKILKFNIGGDARFAITRETLTRTPSRLAQMFSGRWDHKLPRDAEGRFFLDLDRHHMRAIFTWLTELTRVGPGGPAPRHPRDLLPPEHKWGIDELMDYFQLAEPDTKGLAAGDLSGTGESSVPAADKQTVLEAFRELVDVDEADESAIVPLNVSGVRMATFRATLLREPGSLLAARFNPSWQVQGEELIDGGVFLEADPDAFAHVLRYLRLKRLGFPSLGPLPQQAAESGLLHSLLGQYGITGMSCTPLAASAILSREQQLQVASWLPPGARAELLFRASRDGFEAAAFHARCDGQGATLVVAQSAGGHRFGGFADAPWASTGGAWVPCAGAFLFRLGGPQGGQPARRAVKPGAQHGILCFGGWGPVFGGGHALRIEGGSGSCRCRFDAGTDFDELLPGGGHVLAEAETVTLAEYEVLRIF